MLTTKNIDLYVHAGIFHADDVFCAAYLRLYGLNVTVHRVNEVTDEMREAAAMGTAVIADIGLDYDPDLNLFDHHQADAPYRPEGGLYAAFGQLVEHFRKPEWTWIDLFDGEFVRPLDAADNGEASSPVAKLIKAFIPNWDNPQSMDDAYADAVEFAYGILQRDFARRKAAADAVRIVEEAAADAVDGVVVLEQHVPFEGAIDHTSGCKAVVYPSIRGGYCCQILSEYMGSRQLCGSFRGIKAGVNGCTFIHHSGFMASFETEEAAVEAGKKVLCRKW